MISTVPHRPGPDGAGSRTEMTSGAFFLTGADGRTYPSDQRGSLGGHRPGRRYGRLDCPAALAAIARGGYVAHRVFFADEATAIAAGYRPCARCLPTAYREWKRGVVAFMLLSTGAAAGV